MRRFALVTLMVLATGCRREGDHDQDERRAEDAAGLGRCTQEEPGTLAKTGQAVYALNRARTTGDTPVGRYGVVLTCMTQGPAGSSVTIVVPNLANPRPPAGRYRVYAPGLIPGGDDIARLAWAEAVIPAEGGVVYRGMGGELVLEQATSGEALVGSYLVAFERAAEAPANGPARLVLGGAFAAPRNRLAKEAPAPGAGR